MSHPNSRLGYQVMFSLKMSHSTVCSAISSSANSRHPTYSKTFGCNHSIILSVIFPAISPFTVGTSSDSWKSHCTAVSVEHIHISKDAIPYKLDLVQPQINNITAFYLLHTNI
uniref:Uncharacterized protein n=1 Tax=Eucampia antarctica TaxID=49252 RepID=A0A7S2WQ95_9STRA